MPRKRRPPFRDGKVHVCKTMCDTCIFRPGNVMSLEAGRVEQMVKTSTKRQSAIICHSTTEGLRAVCHGFFKLHPTQPLQLAERLGVIEWDEPLSLHAK